jgi:2-dehydro-3-deoxyphosphooctonate aldolase (KDO 8-P synthase)
MAPRRGAHAVPVGSYRLGGGGRLFLIAGPCVIESAESTLRHARKLKEIARRLGIPFIFKSSYDKANRSSIDSFRGPGLAAGLEILAAVKRELGVPVLSDVHGCSEVGPAARVLDIIQIPAFLSRQTDLILEAARTGKPVNVKKGQFLAPEDMRNVVDKIRRAGNDKILLTERGASFGYRTLVTDFRSLVILRELGYPVVFDATHSVQEPGALGKASGGQRRFVPALARAAVAVGCDGLFMEVHERPDRALSDGPNMVPLGKLEALLRGLLRIREISRHVALEDR